MNKNKMYSIVVCIGILAAMFTTACPKSQTAIHNASEASYRLPALTNEVIARVTEARDKGYMSRAQALESGRVLKKLSEAEVVFVGMVEQANNIFVRTGGLPDAESLKLKDFFDAQIVDSFLDILTSVGAISGETSALISTAISALRLAILTIAKGFGSDRHIASNFDTGGTLQWA